MCVVFGAAQLEAQRNVIVAEVGLALGAIRSHLGVADLRIVFLADSAGVIPEVRIGGYNPGPSEVRITLYPGEPDAAGVLREQLPVTLAHEVHHALRRRSVGYGSSLLEAAITEGLADHFAVEVEGGDPPPWAVALTPAELDVWRPQVLQRTGDGYDHARWFHGTSASIPRWTGYAVGFDLVSEYLAATPGATASGLIDEPASSIRSLWD